jgi:YspA, cpYpsA-related SLOG family
MTRVLVCGGRYFDNQDRVDAILDRVHAELGIAVLIQGGQKFWCKRSRRFIGADYQAKVWAEKRGVSCIEEPANWALGRGAGDAAPASAGSWRRFRGRERHGGHDFQPARRWRAHL